VTEKDEKTVLTIAVLGGTGKEGSGLALRWASSGYKVLIGSRDAQRGADKAVELNKLLGGDYISGMSNEDAAAQAHIVVLSVPYDAHHYTLESVKSNLDGKILVDVSVPIKPPAVTSVYVPEGHSAALEAQEMLGDKVRVVAAFQNVSAVHLKKLEHPVDCDVLVCGDHEEAKQNVIQLVEAAGMRGVDAGPLKNAVAVEALTPVLLYINKKYQVKGSGIRITGLA
jgi:NADPH-dependent F420 reductase